MIEIILIIVGVIFIIVSFFVQEKLTGKALAGLALITAGTLLMVVFP